MPKRNEIPADCPSSSGDHPLDPEKWEQRLAEARARRDLVLLHRASKANREKQNRDQTASGKGTLSRMALARAQREEILSRLTDANRPKGPRLVYDTQRAILGSRTGNLHDVGGPDVLQTDEMAEAGTQPNETAPNAPPPYGASETQKEETPDPARNTPTPARAPGLDTAGAEGDTVAAPRLVVFPNLPEKVADAEREMERPAASFPVLGVLRRRPEALWIALLCLSGVFYANFRSDDEVVSAIGERTAPPVSSGAFSGLGTSVSAMTSAPQMPMPSLSSVQVQGRPLPGALQTYAVALNGLAVLQAAADPASSPPIDPGAAPGRPSVSLSPVTLPAPEQELLSVAGVFPEQTKPLYSVAPPVTASLLPVQQSWYDEWQAPNDIERVSHIAVNIPETVPTDRYQSVVTRIEESVFSADVVGTTPFNIAQTHVRYYHAMDRSAAEELANLFDAEARDFTSYSPAPEKGFLELWVSGEGAPPVPSVTRSAPAAPIVVTRSARPPDMPRKASLFERISNAFGGLVDTGGRRATSDRGSSGSAFSGAAVGTASAVSRNASSETGNGSSTGDSGGGTASNTGRSGSNGGAASNAGGGGGSTDGGGSNGGADNDAGDGGTAGGSKGGSKGGDKGGSKGGDKGGSRSGDKGGSRGGKKN